MTTAVSIFEDKIQRVQSAFKAVEEKAKDADLFALKDGVFDAISGLSDTMADPDLKQLLARTAIDIHLFPTQRDGWKSDLIDAVEFAIATAFQTIAFQIETVEEDLDLAA
jgi:hypothetical protein